MRNKFYDTARLATVDDWIYDESPPSTTLSPTGLNNVISSKFDPTTSHNQLLTGLSGGQLPSRTSGLTASQRWLISRHRAPPKDAPPRPRRPPYYHRRRFIDWLLRQRCTDASNSRSTLVRNFVIRSADGCAPAKHHVDRTTSGVHPTEDSLGSRRCNKSNLWPSAS